MLAVVVTVVTAQGNLQYGAAQPVESFTSSTPLLMKNLVTRLSRLVTGENLFTVIWSWSVVEKKVG